MPRTDPAGLRLPMLSRDFQAIPDGLDEIRSALPAVVELIAKTARWVHPDTFRALPVWCPDTARGRPRYDAKWKQQLVSGRGVQKVEENIRAANALVDALGAQRNPKPRNWTVCHIWGYDDEKFAGQSTIVKDPRYYSCVGNMVWLPTPLKGFTDAVEEIKQMLRVCAFHLYGWACEHPEVATKAERIRSGEIPDGYPKAWPTAKDRKLPPGTSCFSPRVADNVQKAKAAIKRALNNDSLENYPGEEVQRVLDFWKIGL
jgi:hypothetical protein